MMFHEELRAIVLFLIGVCLIALALYAMYLVFFRLPGDVREVKKLLQQQQQQQKTNKQ